MSDIAQLNPPLMASPSDETAVSFVPMAAVEENTGRLDASTVKRWSEVKKGFTRFQEGDVVVAKITPSMENGKAALATNLVNGIGAGTTELHVIRPVAEIESRYLLHFLLQRSFRRRARARMTGTAGQLRVPTAFLEEEVLPLPPTSEQRRIVDAIDDHLSRLDASVRALERVRERLKLYRASLLRSAVEGRLVPTEAQLAQSENRPYESAGHLLQRVLDHRRAEHAKGLTHRLHKDDASRNVRRWREPLAPDLRDLPPLPEGWIWASVEQLAANQTNAVGAGPFGTIFKARDFRPEGVPIIFLRHVKADRFLTTKPTYMDRAKWEELFRDYSVYGGELLVTKLGDPPGECAVFPASCAPAMLTPDVMKLQLDTRLSVARFVMHYLNSSLATEYAFGKAFGTTRLRLTLPIFRAMPVPLPPFAEQERIVEELDRILSIAADIEGAIVQNETRCGRLRQSVLRSAFEGKLVDQDPNDEPAAKLLERIRSERSFSSPTKSSRKTQLSLL